jgi:hypothetical protein
LQVSNPATANKTERRNKMAYDSIKIYQKTADAITNSTGIDVYAIDSPEKMAWIVLLLKEIPDSEKNFPFGKWATIQEIERQLQECAKHRVEASHDRRR